jgi:hypothetical protein
MNSSHAIPPKIPSPGWERARVRGIKKDNLRQLFFIDEDACKDMNIESWNLGGARNRTFCF